MIISLFNDFVIPIIDLQMNYSENKLTSQSQQ